MTCKEGTGTGWRGIPGEVQWHSGQRALERPVRLRLRAETLDVAVERQWVEGSLSAGEELTRWFIVRDSERRRFRIAAGNGVERVEIEETE